MTLLPHPSPRDEPEAFARAFLAGVNERLSAWFPRGDVEVKETRLVEVSRDYAVEIIFRLAKAPDTTYGFRRGNVCREATDDLTAAEDTGYGSADVLSSTVTVMLADLEELIHSAGARLRGHRGPDDIVWI